MKIRFLLFFLLLLFLASCNSRRPSGVPSKEKMTEVLADYHFAQAMAHVEYDSIEWRRQRNIEAALRKHGLSREEFQDALLWYQTYPTQLYDIYTKLADRFRANDKPVANVREEEITPEGDKWQDVWAERTSVVLRSVANNRFTFVIEADTSWHVGDKVEWNMHAHWMKGQGKSLAVLSLIYEYEGDSTVSTLSEVRSDGTQLLYAQLDHQLSLRRLRGFVTLSTMWSTRPTTLMLSNIRLRRIHKERPKSIEAPLTLEKVKLDTVESVVEPEPETSRSTTDEERRFNREREIRDSLLRLDNREDDHFTPVEGELPIKRRGARFSNTRDKKH